MVMGFRVEFYMLDLDVLELDIYNVFLINYGIIMIFLWIILVVIGGFGNYFVFLMVGVRDMVFFNLNAIVFWLNFFVGVLLIVSLFLGGV